MKHGRPPFCLLVDIEKNGIKSKLKDSFTIECVPIQLTILIVPRNKHLSKFDSRIIENNSFNLIFQILI